MISRGAASKVASLFYLTPPIAAIGSYFWFDETLSPLALAGMAVIVFGLYLLNRPASMSVSDDEKALIESRRHNPEPGKDFFVFAYGSLMWRPDFPFIEIMPATLYGYHRAFCITSTHYRGNTERPGLVLGLDRGGKCIGRLYRIGHTTRRRSRNICISAS